MRTARLVTYLKSSLWVVPVLCVLAGAALSFGTLAIDRAFDYEAIPSVLVGDPAAVISILSTIAASMVSLTALVLTITMVVVQLAMGQFSPRIVQRILRDKPSQVAIGVFVATFVHAILAVREITVGVDGRGHVPGVAVVTALILVLVSIVVLVLYVHHIGQALRVSSLIELVGTDTRALIEREYPAAHEEAPRKGIVRARQPGIVIAIGFDELVTEATRADCMIELLPALGEFVPGGAPLFRIHGTPVGLNEEALHAAILVDEERSLEHDVAYGVRLLVDIAERSLAQSPFQDPTTAVQAIDRLHDILRNLARRPFHDGQYRDSGGRVRLVVRTMTWEAYVHLAFDEIRLAGAASPQVSRRLAAALMDLRSVVPPERTAVIDHEMSLLSAAVRAGFDHELDSEMALSPDGEGIGEAAGRNRRDVVTAIRR